MSFRNAIIAMLVALASWVGDRWSKVFVIEDLRLAPGQGIEVWPGILNFVMSWNRGINFGLFASGDPRVKLALAALSVIVSIGLFIWVIRHRRDFWFATGVGLVIGGALGNGYDRLVYGAVADFLNVSCCGIHNPFAFNIADVAIFAGVALLLLRNPSGAERDPAR